MIGFDFIDFCRIHRAKESGCGLMHSWGCFEPMLRVLIADEHEVVRNGLRVHLESQPNWQVVGEAANGNGAILNAINTNSDVAVLAYELPILTAIEATRQIRARLPKTEVLIYTAFNI